MSLLSFSLRIYFLFTGIVLWITHGMFHLWLIPTFTLVTALQISILLAKDRKLNFLSSLQVDSCILLIFSFLLLWSDGLFYAQESGMNILFLDCIRIFFVFSLFLVLSVLFSLEKIFLFSYWGIVLVLSLAILLIPKVSPSPFIDIFTIGSDAADLLLHGKNPYLGEYIDIYRGGYKYPPTFTYLPGLAYGTSLAKFLFGDIRYIYVFSVLMCALIMGDLSKGKKNIYPQLWLSIPMQFFVLEQSYVDSFMLFWALLAFWSVQKNFFWLTALSLGYWMSIKQYAFVGVCVFLYWFYIHHGAKKALKLTLYMGAVALALILPLALSAPGGFLRMTTLLLVNIDMRPDAFSMIAWIKRNFNIYLPPWVGLLFTFSFFICVFRGAIKPVSKGFFLATLALTWAIFFLFLKQSFCNYYLFMSGFILPAVIALERESDQVATKA